MDAIRQVTFRPSARTGVMGAALAVGILALTSIQVSAAATVIGSASATPGIGCRNLDTVQESSAGISYAVPAPGLQINQWSTLAIGNLGPAGLLVWRPTTTAGTYTLVAATTPVALVLGPNTFNLTTPIAVQTGDLLGLRAEGFVDCAATAAAGNSMGFHVGPTVGPNLAEAFTPDPLLMLNVTATLGPVPATTPPPGGGGTGSGQNGGGQDQSGNQSGDGSTPVTTKSNPPPTKNDQGNHQDPGHHKKVKGTPTETHSESVEAIFLF
jgi:hypothetical protein